MVRYNNNRGLEQSGGGVFGEIENSHFLAKHIFLYIYVDSVVTDTFTYELSK